MVRIARASTIGTIALLVVASAAGQQFGTADDLASFSLALNDARLSDLGKEVVKKAIESGVQDSQGQLASALCEISATEAIRTADVTQRIAKLKEAVGAYETYLKAFNSGEKAAIARLKLSEWLRTAGETVAAQIKKEGDAAKKEALKNDGLNFFTKAEVLAKARIEELARIPKDKITEVQQAELFALKFAVARMPYSKALLYENREGVEAQSLLNEAQNLLEELDLDLPAGSILSFEARRILALIQVEQKKFKEAEDTLDYSCNTLADAAVADPTIVKDNADNAETRELFARMFLEKAEFLTKTKPQRDWKGAIDTTEKLLKLIPDIIKTKDGKQAMIIMAEALAQEAQTPRAKQVAEQVFAADPSGDAGLKARDLLDKLGTGGGGAGLEGMVKLLAGTVDRKDVQQGERVAAKILAHPELKSKPDVKADTLMQLGGLYFNSGLYAYAAVIFSAVAEEFPGSAKAPEAKFNEAMAFARQASQDGRRNAKFWKEKSKAARTDLNARFPNSKEALDVAWFGAEDARAEGKESEAADLYLKVPPTSPKYGEAQYEGGAIVFRLGEAARLRDKKDEVPKNFQRAEGAYKNAVGAFETTLKTAINAAEITKLKDSLFNVRLMLSGLYIQPEMKKADEALKILEATEASVKGDNARLGKVWSLRIKSLTQLGRGREAITLLLGSKELATAETFIMVAAQVDEESRKMLLANDKDPKVDELFKQTADLYCLAVDKAGGSSKVESKTWSAVGERLLAIGARLSKLPDDMSLFAIDPAVPIAEKSVIEHARKAFDLAGSQTEGDLDRQRAIAFAAGATGNWLDAVSALKDVAEKLPLFNTKGQLNKDVLAKNQRLPDLYQDLAVAYIRAAKGDKAYCDSAKTILVPLIINSDPKSKRYWEARYLHLEALKEAKDYAELDQTLDGLARTAPDADGGKYGIKPKIDAIRAFRDKKIVNK